MQIRYRLWMDILVLLAFVLIAAGGVLWHVRLAQQNQRRGAAALQVVKLALELNGIAYEHHHLSVNWPRNQWMRKLDQLDEALGQPEVRRVGDPELLRHLDQDTRDLRRLVEGTSPAEPAPPTPPPPEGDGLGHTLFRLTGTLISDSLLLDEAGQQQLRQHEHLLNGMLLGGLCGLGLLWVLGSFLFSRQITQSLTGLGAAAGAITRGAAERRLAEQGPAEVKALARAFNVIFGRLRQMHEALNRELEERGREAALREAALAEVHADRALFLEIVNLAPMGLAVFEGAEPRLKWANSAFRNFLDEPYRALETQGLRLEEIIPRITQVAGGDILQQVRQSHRPHISAVECGGDGLPHDEIFWQWQIYPLGTDDPLPDLLLVLVDVTEQSRDRKRLEELAARLEGMNQAKDNFMAILGHELRNPLAPIKNSLYVLRRRGLEQEFQRHSLSIIERQVHHMTRLVDDLLDVSRISRGKIELRRMRVELGKIVPQAVESTSALFQSRGHALDVRLPEEPIVLDADPARLEQILVNLLNNAAKYTEPGGQIGLVVEREGEAVVIRVRDTGVGIAPEMIGSLFEPFSQVARSLDLSQGGLGLGLTLVRSLVQLHGGTIEVRSEGVGKGSEFIVRLPALPEGARPMPRRQGRPTEGTETGLRILIAEDSQDTAASMAELLTIWGHESTVATDGPSVLVRAREYQPDVVLLDIGLPELDGYQVARRLRELPETASVPIIAVSGFGQSEDLDRSRQAGIQHHLTKPIDLGRLQELLTAYARGESLEASG